MTFRGYLLPRQPTGDEIAACIDAARGYIQASSTIAGAHGETFAHDGLVPWYMKPDWPIYLSGSVSDPLEAGLRALADRVENGLAWRSVWPSLHGICDPQHADRAYAERLGVVFAAVRAEADCSQTYLSAVLKRHHKLGTLGDLLRAAASRLENANVQP